MPKRLRIDWRVKGGRKPEGVVMVARPSRWGNPIVVGSEGVPDRQAAVDVFRETIPHWHDDIRRDLRGKDLACYCPLDEPCHADVLLEIANDKERD